MERKGMKRGKGLRTTRPMRRGKNLRQKGRRAEREEPLLEAANAAVRARCGGRCDRCSAQACLEVLKMNRMKWFHL